MRLVTVLSIHFYNLVFLHQVCAELYEDIGGKGADKSALSDNAGGEGQVSIAGPLPRPQ